MGRSSEAQPGSMQRAAAYRARREVQQEAKLAEAQVPCLLSATFVYLNVLNGQYLNFHRYEFPAHEFVAPQKEVKGASPSKMKPEEPEPLN